MPLKKTQVVSGVGKLCHCIITLTFHYTPPPPSVPGSPPRSLCPLMGHILYAITFQHQLQHNRPSQEVLDLLWSLRRTGVVGVDSRCLSIKHFQDTDGLSCSGSSHHVHGAVYFRRIFAGRLGMGVREGVAGGVTEGRRENTSNPETGRSDT